MGCLMAGKLFTHNKRGGLYEIVTDTAFLQCSTFPEIELSVDEQPWTVYRNVHSGSIYVRLTEEFMDGRFSEVPK
jgi:hypothetical protein